MNDFIRKAYFHQSSNIEALKELMDNKSLNIYIGFDATACSLHIGSLMQIMILRMLQKYGHRPIIIVGGGTSKIGDPSGKDESRKYISDDKIEENIQGIIRSLSKFIDFNDEKNGAILLNNDDWLKNINYIEFLRDYGREFSINKMMTKDSVRLRLERKQHLTFLEFNYSILQAYDFYHLNKHHNCRVQIGGSDQWGNIISGIELIKKRKNHLNNSNNPKDSVEYLNNEEIFALTTPLLTTIDGKKMGKSVSGAIWLNKDMCSVFDYYQYWRNIDDRDVERFAALYMEFKEDNIDARKNVNSNNNDFFESFEQFKLLINKDINLAKKELAYNLTYLCHGKKEADEARLSAINLFEKGNIDDTNLPSFNLSDIDLNQEKTGFIVADILFNTRLCKSKSEAKKMIAAGAIKINNVKLESNDNNLVNIISLRDIKNKFHSKFKLSVGKKKHIVISYVK
ncbi:MAG TPA: tyrosine--tRNA ligase [Candidatus Megaira endosymbiont of Hartmannula sinica]|nr:tyrosine--tRNA ligase [Candidatus Megaera endosymbiont of Hartmannula sinica]